MILSFMAFAVSAKAVGATIVVAAVLALIAYGLRETFGK